MAEHPDYQYQKQWKRKPRFGWKQVFLGLGALLVIITMANVLEQYQLSKPTSPTPTTAYIEYGSRRVPSVIPQEVEFSAPELTLSDMNGDPVSLADHRESIILVNTWATWCPGCEAEMPELQAYAQSHAQDNFLVIGINAEESAQQITPFLDKMGLSFPIWLDADKQTYRAFNSSHLPSSFVIDRSGTVRLAWYGPISLEIMEIYVTPLLHE